MVLTESKMVALGFHLPTFRLQNVVDGTWWTQDALPALCGHPEPKGVLVMVMCVHCPYVKHLEEHMAALANQALSNEIAVIAVSANDVANYPQDAPEPMAEQAKRLGFQFPYLYDADQQFVKALNATCTPDFFLFDDTHRLVYRGQYDNSRPGNDTPVTGEHLQAAIEALLTQQPAPEVQHPSAGCNIKWIAHTHNAP